MSTYMPQKCLAKFFNLSENNSYGMLHMLYLLGFQW